MTHEMQVSLQHEEILAGLVGRAAHSRTHTATWQPVAWTYNADGTMAQGSAAKSYGVIDFYREGDYLNCFGSYAIMVCRALGLVRLTVSERHAAAWGRVAGTSHAFIPAHSMTTRPARGPVRGQEPPMTPQENAWLHRNADVDYPHSMTLDPKPNTSEKPGLSGSICIGILSALAIEVVAALIIWGCRILL